MGTLVVQALGRIAAELVRRGPHLALASLRAVARWYFGLGMVAMFLVAAVAGGIVLSPLPTLPGPAGSSQGLSHLASACLGLWLLVVILWGMLRAGGRGR